MPKVRFSPNPPEEHSIQRDPDKVNPSNMDNATLDKRREERKIEDLVGHIDPNARGDPDAAPYRPDERLHRANVANFAAGMQAALEKPATDKQKQPTLRKPTIPTRRQPAKATHGKPSLVFG